MARPLVAPVLAVILLVWCAAAEAVVPVTFGAVGSAAERYAHLGPTFVCFDGKKSIASDQVNDDYCDCSDGSDEPGTSACAMLPFLSIPHGQQAAADDAMRFSCVNKGFKSYDIPHQYINDGICDCCDGSDEYASGIACPNDCAHREKVEMEEQRERERIRLAALEVKEKMMAKALAAREELKRKHKATVEELAVKERELSEALAALPELEEREAVEREERKKRAEAADWISENNDADNEPTLSTSGTAYSCVMWRQTGGCKSVGEREPDSDKSCDTNIESSWSGFCECVNEVTGEKMEHGIDCVHKRFKCSTVCANQGFNTAGDDHAEDWLDLEGPYELPEAKKMRDRIGEAKVQIGTLTKKVDDMAARLESEVGTEDLLRTLKSECFSYTADPKYTYVMCPFDEVRQNEKGSSNGPVLGRWSRFGENTYSKWSKSSGDLTHMLFDNGQRCWNGQVRTTDVHVVCGERNELVSIEEPSMCTYTMVFKTPLMCE